MLGWRTVPTDGSALGPTARAANRWCARYLSSAAAYIKDRMTFERKLYVIRKRAEQEIRYGGLPGGDQFYICSLSYKTLIYKGMLTSEPGALFLSRTCPTRLMETALALVHSRFSTNTFPTWDRAHPYRYLAHNGEINTLRGNVNWMHAQQTRFQIGPVWQRPAQNPAGHQPGRQRFGHVRQRARIAGPGRALAAARHDDDDPRTLVATTRRMSDEKRAFYEYHSTLMEPWDGPASMVFTDGVGIGATLDRNGLRPSRYYVTKDDLVILASEVGVLDIPPETIVKKGRLEPGRMLLDRHRRRAHHQRRGDQTRDGLCPPLPRLAERIHGRPGRPARPAGPADGRHRQGPGGHRPRQEGAATPARLWLHLRRPAHDPDPDGKERHRAAGLDGQRHAAGRAFRQAPTALQLFQAALRPGDQPADRRHPRGDWSPPPR